MAFYNTKSVINHYGQLQKNEKSHLDIKRNTLSEGKLASILNLYTFIKGQGYR